MRRLAWHSSSACNANIPRSFPCALTSRNCPKKKWLVVSYLPEKAMRGNASYCICFIIGLTNWPHMWIDQWDLGIHYKDFVLRPPNQTETCLVLILPGGALLSMRFFKELPSLTHRPKNFDAELVSASSLSICSHSALLSSHWASLLLATLASEALKWHFLLVNVWVLHHCSLGGRLHSQPWPQNDWRFTYTKLKLYKTLLTFLLRTW